MDKMSEISLQWIAFGNMVILAISTLFYGLGGMENGRIFRRLFSPLLIFGAIVLTSILLGVFSWLILITLPLLLIRNSLGYGGDTVGMKLLKRGLIVVLSVLTGLTLVFSFGGGWWLLLIHGVVALPTVLFAFKNEVFARMEETLVCLLLNSVTLCYPFIVK